jgi:PAS domain S-box-containing protein
MSARPAEMDLPAEMDYRLLLDVLPDAVVAANGAGTIVYANAGAERLLGWTEAELVGRALQTVIPERLHAAHGAGFHRFLSTRRPKLIGRAVRVSARRRDGTEVEVELTLAHFRVGQDTDLFVGSLRDLSERVELERQLGLARYLRAATRFSAQLSTHPDPDRILQTVVDALVDDFDAALARIWLYEPAANTLHLSASAGLSGRVADSSRAHVDVATYPYKVGEIARTRRPFLRNGLAGDPQFEQDWVAAERIAAVAGYPLLSGDELIGVLIYFSRRPLQEEVADLLGTFAAIVSATLSDRRRFTQEQAARAEAEAAQHRLAFLAEASALLAASLEYETTLKSVAELAVPHLGDWCVIDLVDRGGAIRRVATVHADPARAALADEILRRYPPNRDGAIGVPQVIRTGRPETVPAVTDDQLVARARDAEHLRLLRALDLGAYHSLPLVARGRTLGALTIGTTRSGGAKSPSAPNDTGARNQKPETRNLDFPLAEELARRAALAVDNARLYQELQEAVRTRDEFLSTVSHDLKSPLGSIKALAQLNLRRVERAAIPEGERLVEGLRRIEGAATRMTAMINQILDVAHLQAGRPLELNLAPVDLVALARQIVADHQATADRHQLRVIADPPELLGRWDAVRLERVLVNLLANAVKYSPDGGEIEVTISAELGGRRAEFPGPAPGQPRGAAPTESPNWAVLTVRDSGLGIPAADLPYIFERFYRAGNVAGRIPGSGIGLAAARQIVEQHGGTIAVESREGGGTTFTVRLPL